MQWMYLKAHAIMGLVRFNAIISGNDIILIGGFLMTHVLLEP